MCLLPPTPGDSYPCGARATSCTAASRRRSMHRVKFRVAAHAHDEDHLRDRSPAAPGPRPSSSECLWSTLAAVDRARVRPRSWAGRSKESACAKTCKADLRLGVRLLRTSGSKRSSVSSTASPGPFYDAGSDATSVENMPTACGGSPWPRGVGWVSADEIRDLLQTLWSVC